MSALLALAAAPARADEPALPPLTDDAPLVRWRAHDVPSEVSATELAWMAREVAPVVERVAGRKLTEMPEIVLASPERISEVVYQEQLDLLLHSEGADPAEAERTARRTARDVGGAFAGKYGFIDHKLYVSVDGVERSMLLEGAPEWLLRPLLRLTIAHELAHALQDQYTDLATLVHQAPTADAIMAINCTVEGHAVWVHEQVGAQTGLGEAVAYMERMLGYDQPIRRRMDPDGFYHAYVYGLGRDFVAWQAEAGGTQRVWRVLAAPPMATSSIVKPARWEEPVDEVDPLLKRAMRRASKRLGGKGWLAADAAMGDYDVRNQLVRAGADSDIADQLDMGWNSRLVGGAMAGVELQLLRFKTQAAALAFVDDMRAQADRQARMVRGDDPFIRAATGPFDRVQADRAAREAVMLTLGQDRLGRVWVVRGSDVVQVVMVNAPATDRALAGSIEQVFRSAKR
ncbi:MAG: hypothetical protein R3F59_04405 [Myxococcota bacterium]